MGVGSAPHLSGGLSYIARHQGHSQAGITLISACSRRLPLFLGFALVESGVDVCGRGKIGQVWGVWVWP